VGDQKVDTTYSIESGKIFQNYGLTLPRQLRSSVLCFIGAGKVVLLKILHSVGKCVVCISSYCFRRDNSHY